MRARPLSVSSARLTSGAFGQLAHADGDDLRGRDPQRHLVLDEIDDEQLELGARDFLLLDRNDLAHAVRRIDDELVGLEALSLGSLFIAGHSGHCSFTGPFAGPAHFGCGSPTADVAARGMRGPPRCRQTSWPAGSCRRNLSLTSDAFFLPLLTRGLHALYTGNRGIGHRKIMLPKGERTGCNVVPVHFLHI